MFRKLLVGIALVCVGAAAGVTVSATGQEFGRASQGVVRTARSVEEFKMAADVTQDGRPSSKSKRIKEHRNLLAVPSHYGKLYAITGHEADAVFWYEDEFGTIRNAVVGGAATRLHSIVSHPTERLDIDYR